MGPEIRTASWWWWLATALALGGALASAVPAGVPLAMGLVVIQALHLGALHGARSFPVQVRLAYLATLAAGLAPGLGFVHGLQLAGTAILLTTDYCPLARCVSLLPWNRRGPLDLAAVRRTFLTPPVRGSILAVTTVAPARPAT